MTLTDFAARVQRYGAMVLSVAATLSLIVFPATMCFDCEPDYEFGRSAAINGFGWDLLLFWLLGGSFLSGLFNMKLGWLAPIAVVVADVATQHLGGVPWWDVQNNEGPVILFVGSLSGWIALAAGYLLHVLVVWVRERWSDPREPIT